MLPHDNCTNSEQLGRIIQKLKDEMILQKLYTHRIVHTMYMRIRSMNVDIPSNLHLVIILLQMKLVKIVFKNLQSSI